MTRTNRFDLPSPRVASPDGSWLVPCLAALALVGMALPASADMGIPASVQIATLVTLELDGADDAIVDTDGRVVFHNRTSSTTRIVFTQRDARAFDCTVDGESVVRSRSTQYLLRGGASLGCKVKPGRYRYTTLSQARGAVQKSKATLRVTN